MLGIFGFILLLAETAGQRVLEQINENANMAMYAKLAYRDVLTGLGNRAAFIRETQETKQSAAPFGYIMVDVNDLKKVNDTLGHPKGDASSTGWRSACSGRRQKKETATALAVMNSWSA